MLKLSAVHRMNMTGLEPDWLDGKEPEQSFRWCFKGGQTVQQNSPSTSTHITEPWAEQQPHLKYSFDQARQQYDSAKPQYYPDSTVVGFNDAQKYAQDAASNRALAGNPLLGMGQQQAQATLRGDYLNPDISGVAASIDQQIRPRVGAQFAKSGRNLSPAHAGTYTGQFTNAIAPYAFNANQAERGRMMQASQMAPALANADYDDIDRLGQVGAMQQGMEQTQLQDDVNRYNFEQNVEQNKLRQYMANISGNYGGTRETTSTQPVYSNPSKSFLGNLESALGIAQGAQKLGKGK